MNHDVFSRPRNRVRDPYLVDLTEFREFDLLSLPEIPYALAAVERGCVC